MSGAVVMSSAVVAVRRSGGDRVDEIPCSRLAVDLVGDPVPWRTFRWYHGQKHYSGAYWSATQAGHVIYESRLELSRLLMADFDCSMKYIAAQPFLLRAVVAGKLRRHVPDYLLFGDDGPVVVDVKPRARLASPTVRSTLAWTREVVEGTGWRYEVSSEPDPVALENIRFLAGYRRGWLFPPALLNELRDSEVDGLSLAEVCAGLMDWPVQLVRSAVLHLMWTRHFAVDVDRPLSSRQVLVRRTGQ